PLPSRRTSYLWQVDVVGAWVGCPATVGRHVIADDLRAKAGNTARSLPADCARAYDADNSAVDGRACRPVLPNTGADIPIESYQVTGQREHDRHRELGYGTGIRACPGAYRDAARGGVCHVHGVVSRTDLADQFQAGQPREHALIVGLGPGDHGSRLVRQRYRFLDAPDMAKRRMGEAYGMPRCFDCPHLRIARLHVTVCDHDDSHFSRSHFSIPGT